MKLPIRGKRSRTRGQALVEFAVVLPVIVLLLLLAVDFGRVFYGWVALNNMARAGANYAALNPTAWSGSGSAAKQAQYQTRMQQDASAIDCTLPGTLPSPTFINQVGTADPHELGDAAEVRLTCQFHLLTPLVSNLLGGGVTLGADAIFPIRQGQIANAPVVPVIPTPTPLPTPTPPPTATPTPSASASSIPSGYCVVPQFVGDANNPTALTGKWVNAGFNGNQMTIQSGTWTSVGSQSQVATAVLKCNATKITVGP